MRNKNKPLFFIILALASSLAPLSVDLLSPSLPQLSLLLQATAHQAEISIYSFLIGYGLAPAFWGYLSDTRGRYPTMLGGMLIYCLSTIICASTNDIELLILLRLAQGFGAAAGATIARAIIRDIYGSSGAAKAISTMLSIMAIIPVTAPLVGGILSTSFSWKVSFAIMALTGGFIVAAFYFLFTETKPDKFGAAAPVNINFKTIITNRVFIQHCLSNMFCVSILILFVSNISLVMRKHYAFTAVESGYVLTMFNASVAVGTYCVWWLMPRLGAHRSILMAATISALGWLSIAALANQELSSLFILLPSLIVSGMGCGVVISLSAGQSLIPFSGNSGTATSIYILIQSFGATAISFAVGSFFPSKQVTPIVLAMALCATLAATTKLLIYKPAKTAPI